ncbi:integrating conjugative element protein, PFL_4693 family [Escherichia coli]|uniref:Integrating conjugative element protein, PFL_4693 family n=1 Tax=Escherichia coli TaxID=562 RepID=A0A376KJ40_ECOLX|nr:integrating conjugative element protein, PFL_4693 family [Escherichia coli]
MQSPGLDPLTVLGIEARTDAERRQLAEKWVKAEYERTEKELAFQREVNAAWKRLYPGVMPVSLGKGGRAAERQRRTAGVVCESERLWHL